MSAIKSTAPCAFEPAAANLKTHLRAMVEQGVRDYGAALF